jgi:hypothetical protein
LSLQAETGRRGSGWFIFLMLFFIGVMLPLSTYSNFREALSLDITSPTLYLVFAVVVAAIILTQLLQRLPVAVALALEVLLLLVGLFFAYNYFAGDYGGKVIGADADVLDRHYSNFELVAFVIIAILVAVFSSRLRPYFQIVALLLVLPSFGNLVPLFSGKAEVAAALPDDPLGDEEFLTFSTGTNVVHIILDGMQGTLFSKMLQSEESMNRLFTGFTFFPDTLASSEVTYLAIPSVVSGRAWDGVGSIKQYKLESGALAKSDSLVPQPETLLKALSDNEFMLQVLSAPGSGMEERDIYDLYFSTDFMGSIGSHSTRQWRLLDLTLIKVMPWSVKRTVYSNGDWWFSRNTDEKLPQSNKALQFLALYGARMTSAAGSPAYKLIHLLTPHAPWTTAQDCSPVASRRYAGVYDQSRCAMLGIGRLMDAMRSAGVYDNTYVVVHGDHGICHAAGMPRGGKTDDNIPRCVGNANPLLMIKPLMSRGELQIDSNPVELTDIAPTLLDGLALEHSYSGENAYDAQKTRARVRNFYEFEPNRIEASKQDKVDRVLRYEVSGPIHDHRSWCNRLTGNCTAASGE